MSLLQRSFPKKLGDSPGKLHPEKVLK